MNVDTYLHAMLLPRPGIEVSMGGQELILGEVAAALWPYKSVWLPFPDQCETLSEALQAVGMDVYEGDSVRARRGEIETCYFGTPTIVDDRVLFPHPEDDREWTKDVERETVRGIVGQMREWGGKRVVSGLGSGDITPEERIEDCGGGRVVCEKHFEDFTDWVIVTDLED